MALAMVQGALFLATVNQLAKHLFEVKFMNPILPEPNRIDKLKGWLRMHRITYAKLAAQMGMSELRLGKIINRDYAMPHRVEQLRALGVPEELLPEARNTRLSYKKKQAATTL